MKVWIVLAAVLLAACKSGGDDDFPASVGGAGGSGGSAGSGGSGGAGPNPPPPANAPRCASGEAPLLMSGSAAMADAKTYRMLPFDVVPGTTRIEVGYRWTDVLPLPSTPITQTVFDLGLWDNDGYRSPFGFRGWSGSRQGKIGSQPPVFVQSDSADRGYTPGAIEPGVWYVDLGIAAVGPSGANWEVQVACLNPPTGPVPSADPVNASHVARTGPAWYHADTHMHGFHSNPNAPDDADFIEQARAAQLDVLFVTEYVTGRHWDELGALQRAHPDLLIWPGREIITYFGHANTFGETRGVLEYRHGFEDVTLGEIQRLSNAEGALFQVNHPLTFPGPLFANFCRGCAFELGGNIDWNAVDTVEVANGPILVDATDLGLPLPIPLQIQNPFTQPAIDLWQDLLMQGYKITATSGSDSKGVDAPTDRARKGYGSSATAIYAQNLSRAAISAALRAGHAYIRTRGVMHSPALEFRVETMDGQRGIFGDTVMADTATLTTVVTGGQNQFLVYTQNGQLAGIAPITSDPFTHTMTAGRASEAGPLGTFWRVDTFDLQSLTTIGNPVFLQAPP
ncbi:MAG: CehA/McbA family metallohydrolase [Nevskiales bacterium]